MKIQAVVYTDPDFASEAEQLGAELGVNVLAAVELAGAKPKHLFSFLRQQVIDGETAGVLVLAAEGLDLYALGVGDGVRIRADFHGPTVSYRRNKGGGRGQMVARAVGVKSGYAPTVLDATAGLGSDGFVLASLGCQVTLLERVAGVRALLASGLAQAKAFAAENDAALLEILARMQVLRADALTYLSKPPANQRPDVIYLDPMFPDSDKRSMVKKEMRVFHHLVGEDADADQLLDLALKHALYRVVVKRPRIAPNLAGLAPNHVLEGRSNRFDIYTIRKLPESGALND